MNNLIELGYPLLRYNYVVVFFASIILIYFFTVVIIRLFDDRVDFNNILEVSDKIYVKFDFNGIIIDSNNQFTKIASINSETTKGKDLFKLIKIEDYDMLVEHLFNEENDYFVTNITCRNGDIKRYRFSGIKNTNYFGAGTTYLLIGSDITSDEYRKKEFEYNKQLLENLTLDYRFAEEEIKRNFDQIQSNKVVIEELRLRHDFFVNTLPLGIVEFDFFTRQLNFSPYVIQRFFPDMNTDSMHPDDILQVISNMLDPYTVYDIVEGYYHALENNIEKFDITIDITSRDTSVTCDINIHYKGDEPEYLFIILNYKTLS